MTRSESSFRRELDKRVRKQHIRAQVSWERQRGRRIPAVCASAIPMVITDDGGDVRYHASMEDLRAVMDRLPSGTLNGLAGIELRKPEQPGTVGDYDPWTGWIRIFGYVDDPSTLDRPIRDMFLRLKMLNTLVHELGHHFDHATRTHRSWHVSDEQAELQAESFSESWLRTCVFPYLEETYPEELGELRRWMREHGGVVIPLELLVGRPPTTARVAGKGYLFDSDHAFENLLHDVHSGTPPLDAKATFAFWLHFGYHFDLALEVVDDVLARDPAHFEALGTRLHIFAEHLERHDEAVAIAHGLLLRDPEDYQSLRVICGHAWRQSDWPTVVETSSRLLDLEDRKPRPNRFPSLAARLRARIELGDQIGAEQELRELEALPESAEQHADHVQGLALKCATR